MYKVQTGGVKLGILSNINESDISRGTPDGPDWIVLRKNATHVVLENAMNGDLKIVTANTEVSVLTYFRAHPGNLKFGDILLIDRKDAFQPAKFGVVTSTLQKEEGYEVTFMTTQNKKCTLFFEEFDRIQLYTNRLPCEFEETN